MEKLKYPHVHLGLIHDYAIIIIIIIIIKNILKVLAIIETILTFLVHFYLKK